jgi:nicotinamide-nucleotide amidase
VLRGGLITYVEDTKIALAGVAPQLLDAVGPVAAPPRGYGRRRQTALRATWGDRLTGVAGPEPHGGHPVGTVFLGLAGPIDTEVVELSLSGSRWDIGSRRCVRPLRGCARSSSDSN